MRALALLVAAPGASRLRTVCVVALAIAAGLAVAGCATPAATSPKTASAAPSSFGDIVKVGTSGNEPVVRVAPDGTVYVAALQYLYVSTDGGATFKPVDFKGAVPLYATDSALAVSPEGRVYIAWDWPYAGHTAVCGSSDRGATWQCDNAAVPGATDRMWIAAPTANDVYLITGQTLDRPTFAVSHDKGASWSITYFDPNQDVQGADLAWDPVTKQIVEGAAAPSSDTDVSPATGWGVRVFSADGSYKGFTPVDLPSPSATVAIDASGAWWATACTSRTGDCKPAVAKSVDQGKTWTLTPMPFRAQTFLLPFVAAGEAGHVATAWYQTNATRADDPSAEWHVVVAWTSDGATWKEEELTPKPVHTGAMCSSASCLGEDRFAGDFLGVAFGPDSALHVTWMRQIGSKGVPTTQLSTGVWDQVEYARTR